MFRARVSTDSKKIDELLTRGVAEALPTKESLRKLLMSGRRLRIKLGIDPTGAKLHIGHSVPLLKLRDFQELGHTVVFIIGDATGVVGDTSDKENERPMLSDEEIKENFTSYVAQVSKILKKDQLEVRRNSEWLLKLTYRDIGEEANLFSLADFSARDNIKRRLDEGKRVSLREVLYPLMQGHDSVAVKADVELGGSDQRFNLLAGRTLQEHFRQTPQHILMFSLVTDASGKKLSKTGTATIFLTDPADEMFGKAMSVTDELVRPYFISMTRVPFMKIEEIMHGHPKEAKLALAEELTRMYHGAPAATKARARWEATFSKGEIPSDVSTVCLDGRSLADALVAEDIVKSKTDFRRLEAAGAIRKLSEDASGTTYKIGKHRFVKIVP